MVESCSKMVMIPAPGSDQPPVITVSAVNSVAGAYGAAEKGTITVQGTLDPLVISNVDQGTSLLFTSSASGAGGVKSYSISITTQSRISSGMPNLFDVSQSTAKNSSGLVPNLISIPETTDGKILTATANSGDLVIVTVSAENWNMQKTSSKLVYYAVDRKNQQQTRLNLQPVAGTSVCQNTFPTTFPGTSYRANCQILALENPNGAKNVYLLKPGADCSSSSPSSIVVLIAPLTDISGLYGTANTPTLIQCCNVSFNPNQQPIFPVGADIPILVNFKCN